LISMLGSISFAPSLNEDVWLQVKVNLKSRENCAAIPAWMQC
jgi:hypothetical protein